MTEPTAEFKTLSPYERMKNNNLHTDMNWIMDESDGLARILTAIFATGHTSTRDEIVNWLKGTASIDPEVLVAECTDLGRIIVVPTPDITLPGEAS